LGALLSRLFLRPSRYARAYGGAAWAGKNHLSSSGTSASGGYRCNEEYKRYPYADIHQDIYDFYKYCEVVFTNQSTVWVKQ
jgi:hypothetical protein